MRLSPVAAEHTQEDIADHVVGTNATIARVAQRAMFHELFPAPTYFEKLEEEDKLTIASRRGVLVPFGVEPPARGVQRPRLKARKKGVGKAHPQAERLIGPGAHSSSDLRGLVQFSIHPSRIDNLVESGA